MSPLQYAGLGFTAPLISFGGNRAPVHPWPTSKDNMIYRQWPHGTFSTTWALQGKSTVPPGHQLHEGLSAQGHYIVPSTTMETCPGDLPRLCHHTKQQVSSPVSSTSPTHLASLKTFFKSLIWQKNCLAYLDLQKTPGFRALAPVDN